MDDVQFDESFRNIYTAKELQVRERERVITTTGIRA